MAQTITITTFNGIFPFDVYICDYAYNQCYLATSSVSSVPITVDIPTQLDGLLSVLVLLQGFDGCQYFEQYTCSLTPNTETCYPIFQNNSQLYSNGYNITPNDFAPSADVAHFWDESTSTGYVWISINTTKVIREWKIINLSPFTYDTTYNGIGYRDISYPTGINTLPNGMCAKGLNEIVSLNVTTRRIIIIVLDPIPFTTSTFYNTGIEIPPLHIITGDILYTTTNKVLVTLTEVLPIPAKSHLKQYDVSGTEEITKLIGGSSTPPTPNITTGVGLYQENNLIYIVNSVGQTFNVSLTYPYTITNFAFAGLNPVEGASQTPQCMTVSLFRLTQEELSCLCLTFINPTNYDIPVNYNRCDGVYVPQICNSGTTLHVCGSNPQSNDPLLQIISGLPCVNNTCDDGTTLIPPSPTPTVTVTHTVTPTIAATVTPTKTPVTPTPTKTTSQTPVTPTPTKTTTLTPSLSPAVSTSFRSVWIGSSITLPYKSTGTYTGIIYWGDGTTSVNSYANRSHTYASSGTYTIIIDGTINGFSFGFGGDRLKLKEITNWGSIRGENNSNTSMFYGCSNLVLTGVSGSMITSGITSFNNMFRGCHSITTVPGMGDWDTSSVTGTTYMFLNASGFNQSISAWTTTSLVNMEAMFNNAVSFNQNIDSWDTRNVTNMEIVFAGAVSFNQPLGSWVTSAVTSMYGMFTDATLFNNGGSPSISGWNVSNVITMNNLFLDAQAFNQDLGNWDVSSVTGMTAMLSSTNLSTTNYDNTLVGWNSLPSLQNGVTVGAAGLTYTAAGAGGTARSNIISNYSWTFNGDSGV